MRELVTSATLGIITMLLCVFAASLESKENFNNVNIEEQLDTKKELKAPLIETLTSNYKVVDNQNSI